MVNYVEQATLKVNDQSSRKIAKINRELKKLFTTARRGKLIRIDFRGLKEAQSDIAKMRSDLRTIGQKRLRVRISGLSEAKRSLDGLAKDRSINFNIKFKGIAAEMKALRAHRSVTAPVRIPVSFKGIQAAVAELRATKSVATPVKIPVQFSGLKEGSGVLNTLLSKDGRMLNLKLGLTGVPGVMQELERIRKVADRDMVLRLGVSGTASVLLSRLEKSGQVINFPVRVEGATDALAALAALKSPRAAIEFKVRMTGDAGVRNQLNALNKNIKVKLELTHVDGVVQQIERVKNALAPIIGTNNIRLSATGLTKTQVTNVKNLTAQLKELGAYKDISIGFTFPGLKEGLADARALNNTLKAINQRKATVSVGAGGGSTRKRVTVDWGQGIGSGFLQTINPRLIGTNIARGMSIALTGEMYMLGRQFARATVGAPLNTEDARQQLRATGRSAGEVGFVESIAEEMSQQFPAVPASVLISSSREVLGSVEGDLRDSAEFVTQVMERLARNAAILSGTTGQTGSDVGEEARKLEKVLGIIGARNDPERAAEFSEAVVQGVIASGGDLSVAEAVRTLQQLGAVRSDISPEAFLQSLLNRDEGGRRGTGEIRQAYEDLIRGNLNEDDLTAQIQAGLRDKDGRSLIANEFADDILGVVQNEFLPRLRAAGVDTTDATAVREALDVDLGFSKQGGITALTDFIVNFEARMAEFNRAIRSTPETFIEEPTTRQRARQVSAQWQNVASEALEGALPFVEGGLDLLQESLGNIAQGEGSIVDIAKLVGSVAPVAASAALSAIAEGGEGAALGSAALALTGAAGSLTIAAGLLGSAVGAPGVGKKGGGLARKALSFLGGGLGATAAFLGSATGLTAGVMVLTPSALGDGTMSPEAERYFSLSEEAQKRLSVLEQELSKAKDPSVAKSVADEIKAILGTAPNPIRTPSVDSEYLTTPPLNPVPTARETGPLPVRITEMEAPLTGTGQAIPETMTAYMTSAQTLATEAQQAFSTGSAVLSEAGSVLSGGASELLGAGGVLSGAGGSLAAAAAALNAAAGALAAAGARNNAGRLDTGANNPM